MAGCDGSPSSRTCTICNGTGFKIVPVMDKEFGRIKPVAAVCLGKKNETAEAYHPKLSLVPQVEEKDLENLTHGLSNYIYIGDQQYALFETKKMVVASYYKHKFRVLICSSTLLMEGYMKDKDRVSLSDYLAYDLLVFMMDSESDNPVFKSAALELIKSRVLENRPTWIHVPAHKAEINNCKEYSPDLENFLKGFKVIRKSLARSGSKSNVSSKFSSI